jgi:hypothetical protein
MNKETILYTLERDLNIMMTDICSGKKEISDNEAIFKIELLEQNIENSLSVIKAILDEEL